MGRFLFVNIFMKYWSENVGLEELSLKNELPKTDINPTEKRIPSKHVFKDGFHTVTRTFDLWNLLCAEACINYYNTLRGLEGKFSISYTEIYEGYYLVTKRMPQLDVPQRNKHNMDFRDVDNLIDNLNKIDRSRIEKYIGGIFDVNGVDTWKLICMDIGNCNSFVYNNEYYLLDLESFAVIPFKDGIPIKLNRETNRKPKATNCASFIDNCSDVLANRYFKQYFEYLYSF